MDKPIKQSRPEPNIDTDLGQYWLKVMKDAHEIGLMAQRNAARCGVLQAENRLFLTRSERHNSKTE